MSRLTKRNNKGYVGIKGYHGLLTSYCYECTEELEDGVYLLEDALNKLAEYEDLEEQGLLLRLPCKVGDKVYKISRNKVKECEVVFVGISADEKCSYFNFVENYADGTFCRSYSEVFNVIGKTIFLTREEAEQKLKGEDKQE